MKSIEQLEKEHRRRMQQDRKYRDKIVWAAQGGLLDGITTPKNVTEGIRLFCERISGGHESRIVPVEPYSWSRVSCCEMNVRELIRLEGDGEPVLGYKIWANNMYVEAVPHCVLKRLDGTLTDPTFNVDGEKTVLFVEAPNLHTATISNLGEKPCEALDPDVEFLVALKKLEDAMTLLEFPTEEEAWMTELTYEQSLERRTV